MMGQLILTFFVGVFASFIGAMVGSAGLITIPFLLFLGLPPHVAIATHKVGAVGLKIGAIIKFRKTNFIQWKYFLPFTLISVIAALIGAQLLIWIDKKLLSDIVIVLLLLVLPLVFLKKDIGVVQNATSVTKKVSGYILYFFTQVFGAFFGGGAATIAIFVLMSLFGLTIIEASATAMLPSLILNTIAIVIFAINGMIEYDLGLALFGGMMLGGWLGARVAVKRGNAWVKVVFVGVVLVLILKLVLDKI